MTEGQLQRGTFAFSVGRARVLCDIDPELSAVVPFFVDPSLAEAPLAEPQLALLARRGRSTSPAERGLPLTCSFGPANGFTGAGRIELWDGSSLVVAQLDGTSVRAEVAPGSDPHLVGAVMLFTATAMALRAHGLFHLHAACVQVQGLGAVLIVGESGAGKTTLAVGLAALGGSLVSDDAVFLSDGPQGTVDVWGWPADMHLGAPTSGAFPQFARHAYGPACDPRDKRAVPLSALGSSWLRCASGPRLVLFPRIRPVTVSRLSVLAPAETVARLLQQSGLVVVSGAARSQEHLELIAEVANGGIGVEVTLGADALPVGSALLERLQALVRQDALRSHQE